MLEVEGKDGQKAMEDERILKGDSRNAVLPGGEVERIVRHVEAGR